MPSSLRRSLLVLALVALLAAVPAGPASARLDGPFRIEQTPPNPTLGQRAASVALRQVGVPYRWGGSSPASGFDCSGLVYWAYGKVGVSVPHSSYALYGLGRSIRQARMKAGDILFFAGLGHVGLYVGHGQMVHAPQSGRNVEVVNLRASNYGLRLVGVRRLP